MDFFFFMISGCRLTLQVTELGFSGEKNCGLGFLGQNDLNWTQIKAFTVLSKINAWHFFDYAHDVTLIQKLKSTQMAFSGKSFVEVFRGDGPKWFKVKFFKFYQKSMHGTFMIFCMKLQ